MAHLLLVDDESNVLKSISRMCWNEKLSPSLGDLRITTFESPFDAIEFAERQVIDVVVSDFRMPQMNGVAFLTRIRELQPDATRIIVSAFADRDGIISAINDAGIFRFVTKPWVDLELKGAIGAALVYRQDRLENKRLADAVRHQRGELSASELALRRLAVESPAITRVQWDEDGGVLLEN